MKSKTLMPAFLGLILLLGVSAATPQSLGDFARQQREKQAREGKKAAKIYTNENMPVRPLEEGATAAAGISTKPADDTAAKSESAPGTPEPSSQKTAGEAKSSETPPATDAEKPADKVKTRDYWQSRFKSARADLTKAEEEQQVVQDEVQLLQIQQAREISPQVQSEVKEKISAKNAELDAKRAVTAKAQTALEDLEKDFKDSGAPEEWSKTE